MARHVTSLRGIGEFTFRRYGYRDKETLIIIITVISDETFGVPSRNDTPPLPNCS